MSSTHVTHQCYPLISPPHVTHSCHPLMSPTHVTHSCHRVSSVCLQFAKDVVNLIDTKDICRPTPDPKITGGQLACSDQTLVGMTTVLAHWRHQLGAIKVTLNDTCQSNLTNVFKFNYEIFIITSLDLLFQSFHKYC